MNVDCGAEDGVCDLVGDHAGVLGQIASGRYSASS